MRLCTGWVQFGGGGLHAPCSALAFTKAPHPCFLPARGRQHRQYNQLGRKTKPCLLTEADSSVSLLVQTQFALQFLGEAKRDDLVGCGEVVLEVSIGEAGGGVVLDPLHTA